MSKDSFNREQVNGGEPVLWSNSVRNHTIVRTKSGKFYILSTDLSLANYFDIKYEGNCMLRNPNSGKMLDIVNSGTADGTNVQIYQSNRNHRI